jgi:hypothetical protein
LIKQKFKRINFEITYKMDKYVQFGNNKVYTNMKKIKHYKIVGLELLRNTALA